MQNTLATINSAITSVLNSIPFSERNGREVLEPAVRDAIRGAGLQVDPQDTKRFLGAGLPLWRDREGGETVTPRRHSAIDMVVYDGIGRAVALVEIESSLGDLKKDSINLRSGHYDVYSIAKNASGKHFYSYKSLERMAAAVFYSAAGGLGRLRAIERFERLISDDSTFHNPLGLGIFLAVGHCRKTEIDILCGRLKSLNAELLCSYIH